MVIPVESPPALALPAGRFRMIRTRRKGDRQVITAAIILDEIAPLVTEAYQHIAQETHILDGYPARTISDGMPTGNAEMTSVERIANARMALIAQHAQIRDDVATICAMIASLRTVCRNTIGIRAPREEVTLCDGRPFDGSGLVWVPHSRDPHNGWMDPACVDAADESGLCPRCRIRERRYRDAHGLAPRQTNAETPAAA